LGPDDDEPHTAAGLGLVIGDVSFGPTSVVGEVGEMGARQDPVLDRDGTDFERGADMLVAHYSIPFSSAEPHPALFSVALGAMAIISV
jgi:hypothetical protein